MIRRALSDLPFNKTVYCDRGTSDKQYTVLVELMQGGDLYQVRALNGKRGGEQTSRMKSKAPLPLAAALVMAEKIIAEKKNATNGYTDGADVEAALESNNTGAVFMPPMLLDEIDMPAAVVLLESDEWVCQIKKDGIRFELHVSGDTVTGFSRTGNLRAVPFTVVHDAVNDAPWRDYVLDGELVGDNFYAFDVLSIDGRDLRGESYDYRRALLEEGAWEIGEGVGIVIVETAETFSQKFAMVEKAKTDRAEGFVLKRRSASYTAGKKTGDAYKFKFWASASVIVETEWPGGMRSIRMKMTCGSIVGQCTIPPNHEVPKVGQIVEVRYLYFVGAMVQAIYAGVREDIPADDCTMSQLKMKQGYGGDRAE